MLETVAASATIDTRGKRLTTTSVPQDWPYRRRGVVSTWTHPKPPPGISRISLSEHPSPAAELDPFTGKPLPRTPVVTATIEGNLTALAYGPELTWASLAPEEVPRALRLLLNKACEYAPNLPASPGDWNLDRVDPSATWQLPDHLTPSDVIGHTRDKWAALRTRKQAIAHHESTGATATLRRRAGVSWSVYDKSAEAHGKGQDPLPNLLRTEARLHLKKLAHYSATRPTLAIDPLDLAVFMQEIDALSHSIALASATGSLALVRQLVAHGCPVTTAMRLTTYANIKGTYGDSPIRALGLNDRTTQRWTKELRDYLGDDADALVDAVLDDLPNLARAVLAKDVRRG